MEELLIEEAVQKSCEIFLSKKKDTEEIIQRVKEEAFSKKLTKKQKEMIEREHSAILILKTVEIFNRNFSKKTCKKILIKLYRRIYSLHCENMETKTSFKITRKKTGAAEFIKFFREKTHDYQNIFINNEEEWPRKLVDYLDKQIFNRLDFSRALTLSIGFISSFNKYEKHLSNNISALKIRE